MENLSTTQKKIIEKMDVNGKDEIVKMKCSRRKEINFCLK